MWSRLFLGAIAIFAVGCGPQPLCITDHGMEYMGLYPHGDTPESWSCSKLNTVESKMIQFLRPSLSPKGYKIWQRDTAVWTDPWDRRIAGYTYCQGRMMEIGTSRTVFAHELAHVLQGCSTELPADPGQDIDHSDWIRKDIYNYIEEASQ